MNKNRVRKFLSVIALAGWVVTVLTTMAVCAPIAAAADPEPQQRPPPAKWNLNSQIADSIFSKRAIALKPDFRLAYGAKIETGRPGSTLGDSVILDDDQAHVVMEYPAQAAPPEWYLGLWVRLKSLKEDRVRILFYFSDHSWIGLTSKSIISFNPEADDKELRYQEQAHSGLIRPGEMIHLGIHIFTHEGVRSLAYFINGTPLVARSTPLITLKLEEKEQEEVLQSTVEDLGETPAETFVVKSSRPKTGFDPMASDREPGKTTTLFDFGTERVLSRTFVGNPKLPSHPLDLLSAGGGRKSLSGQVDELRIYSLNQVAPDSLWFAEFSCNVALGTLVDLSPRAKESNSPQLVELRKLAQRHGLATSANKAATLAVCEQFSLGPDDTDLRRNEQKLCTSTTQRRATLQGELEDRCLRKKVQPESLK